MTGKWPNSEISYLNGIDRDLELGVADSQSVRVIPFPCRRILGGWIKAETKTRIVVCPTHWREWSTDRNAPCSP